MSQSFGCYAVCSQGFKKKLLNCSECLLKYLIYPHQGLAALPELYLEVG